MIEIKQKEESSEFEIMEDYFFSKIRLTHKIISQVEVINMPFKSLLLIKKSMLDKENITNSVVMTREIWYVV